MAETAFFHRPTKSLVTTDAVVYVPDEPPPIFGTYFGKKDLGDPSFWPKSVIQAVFLPLREDGGADAASAARWPGYASVRGRLLRAPILRVRRARPPRCAVGVISSRWTSTACSPRTRRGGGVPATPPRSHASARRPTRRSCADWALLDGLNELIDTNKLGAPVKFDFKAGCG